MQNSQTNTVINEQLNQTSKFYDDRCQSCKKKIMIWVKKCQLNSQEQIWKVMAKEYL